MARGLEERIEHGGRGDADRRLADAAPGVAASGWHEDRFDFRHFGDAHRVVVIEVGLLDAAVLDGALLIEQRGQAVDERARDLPVDLGRVDGVGWICCADDPVHFDLVAASNRDFRRSRHIGVERLHVCEPTIDALRCRLAPTDSLGHGVEHGEVSRMLCHQFAPEFELVLADGLRQLVHEALQEDGVLVDVHATPEPRLDVRIAHGMVDHQVRDRVAECVFRPGGHQTLERQRVFSLVEVLRENVRQDRLAGEPHVQRGQIVVGIESAGELALHHRMIAAMRHVLLARP